ncbi:hypothetical protein HK096_006154, partial [Nowakowskiella sp. JEL0078]
PKLALLMPKPDHVSRATPTLNPSDIFSPVSWISPSLSPEAFFNYGNTQAQSPTFESFRRPSLTGLSPINERDSLLATLGTLGISSDQPNTQKIFSHSIVSSSAPLMLDFGVVTHPMKSNQVFNQQTQIFVPVNPPWTQGNPQFHPEWNFCNPNLRQTKTFADNPKPSNPPRKLPPFQKPRENPGPPTEEDLLKQKARVDIQIRIKQRLEEKIKKESETKLKKATDIKISPKGKSKRLECSSNSSNLIDEDTASKRQKLKSENTKSELKTNNSEEFGESKEKISNINSKAIVIRRSQRLSGSAVIPSPVQTTQVSQQIPVGMVQSPPILSNQLRNSSFIIPDNVYSQIPPVGPIISTVPGTPVYNSTVPTQVLKYVPEIIKPENLSSKPEPSTNNHILAISQPTLTLPILLSMSEVSTRIDSAISALSGGDSSPTITHCLEHSPDTNSPPSMHLASPTFLTLPFLFSFEGFGGEDNSMIDENLDKILIE